MAATGPTPRAPRREGEERLLVEAAQKDPSRFAELYERNFEGVYAYVARRARGREEAEDLTSEVFHRALKNLSQFEWRGVPFVVWLLRIAANALADHWKRTAQERQFYGSDTAVPESFEMEQVEQQATLYRLVDQLPPDQRLVVVRRFAEQRSIREISRELGRTEGAVKQLQFRALRSLRARMDRTHG